VWEFVGILAKTRLDLPQSSASGEEDAELANHPKIDMDLIPRLHCIKFRKVASPNPLVSSDPITLTQRTFKTRRTSHKWAKIVALELQQVIIVAQEMRSTIVEWLTPPMGGDALAVEYLLCNMLSRVYARPNDVDVVGNFPVNLSHVPIQDNWARSLHEMISAFLPRSFTMQLKLETLKRGKLFPYKDYDEDRYAIKFELSNPKETDVV